MAAITSTTESWNSHKFSEVETHIKGNYIKTSDTEQTIASTISSMSKGVVDFYRSSGNHFSMIGFSNKNDSGSKQTLGFIGFKSGNPGQLAYRDTSGNAYDIYHSGNFTPSNYSLTSHTHSYLPLGGGTMTGVLTLKANQYGAYDGESYGFNANNSDIINVNSIITCDASDSWKESIGFKRSNGNYDTFRALDGTFYFGVNNGTEYTAIHSGNIGNQSVNYATSAGSTRKLADNYDTRPTTANISLGDGTVRFFEATSSMTTGKPPIGDSSIIHLSWDNNGGWDKQIALGHGSESHMMIRSQSEGSWQDWLMVLDSSNYSSYALPKTGGTVTGNVTIKGKANADTALSLSGSQYTMDFLIGSGNVNRGIYNRTGNYWMLYFDASNTYCNYGNFICNGGVTSLSDIREKAIVKNIDISTEQIASASSVLFKWNDKRDDELHAGSIAQDWQEILPQAVLEGVDEKKTLSLNYGVAALVSSITTARDVVSIKEKIKSLEDEIAKLKEKL